MTTITIELCTEDRARLDAILDALKGTPNCSGCVEHVVGSFNNLVQTRAEAPQPAEIPTEAPAELVTPPAEEKPKEAAPEHPLDAPPFDLDAPAPTVDRADIQRKVVELSSAGKKAEVKAIVTGYADRVSAIPEDKLAEVFEKLNALEG